MMLRSLLAAIATLVVAVAAPEAPAVAAGFTLTKPDTAAVALPVETVSHRKRRHHHHYRYRHIHHPHVIFYHSVPRPTWHAYRYYTVPRYTRGPYYYSAWSYPYAGAHGHPTYWRYRRW